MFFISYSLFFGLNIWRRKVKEIWIAMNVYIDMNGHGITIIIRYNRWGDWVGFKNSCFQWKGLKRDGEEERGI